ncbi:putative disease resistance RPP13-like protein 1 [Beta vulgaris subsp. vulgaris]|uniref:putative disease resistance RPP13-like protein 1 n=1 Tax=Beta vulgaris subsp. vulgaris TaxID=3555 RepID=UPI00054025BF|nr:putative disease resistance RPP13-like protein 1 [Beta vulgaris subsp. vulgaris]XP_010670623.1 putative disease resistance RPP13-like protein 1 [Beta vulgaris subsp. vulgaris]XP_019103592.1 putative disease resistance RPP13-like protein 1 [Beta vulgaris subsp. vulgaris]XP_048494123.1 putative disease resistance RPP13-like protein 1 [Beta vulgaris subsp. vulgaris]
MPVGEVILGAVLQVIFEKLASAGISQFLKLAKRKNKKIEAETIQKWEQTLRMIATLLTDAEHRRQTDKGTFLKKWFEDLEDLAYDLEDILDEFATEAQLFMLQKEAKEEDHDVHDAVITGFFDSAKHKVKSLLACGSTAGQQFQYSKEDLPSRIREINIRLERIHTQARDFGLIANSIMQQETHRTEASNASWRQSTSLVCEKNIYGRDDKRNEIIEKLLKDEPTYENVVVIPIVGMGGVGKTTLAQYVYNDEQQLKGHFDLKAWVCVSDVFDVKHVTTEILNSFTNGKHSFSSLNQAQENLMKVLKGKKFLIILDDIWSEKYSDWNALQTPFRQGLKGSRIIVTTRKDISAKMVISNLTQNTTIYLKGLSDDDCWCIFQQHINDDPDLDEMWDDIVKKCAGLPLAAKALGGLLKSTVDKRQCRSILESSIWSEKSDILPVLLLSYHNLSSNLKRSFAYCSVLPKDYEFNEMEVVLLWMAQGFIPEDNSEKMEDVGHDYFFDLVSRSLFEECSPSYYYGGRPRKFIMHDLIHDLAQWAAGDMCCVMGALHTQTNPKRTRHIYLTENEFDEMLENKFLNPPQLRTLLCLPLPKSDYFGGLKIEILECVQRFTYIRAMRLCSGKIKVLPECIGDLIHLRYLLLNLLNVGVLPKSISKLCNLQTLDLRGCRNLKKVPNVRFLVKLRHLHIGGIYLQEMPLGIGRLKNLQTLEEFVLAAERGSRIRELSNLLQLSGGLSIFGLENVTSVEDAQKAQLHEKKGLDKLHLEWESWSDEVDDNTKIQVLEHLNPHTSIKECFLRGYRGLTFPTWLGDSSFSLMVDIELTDCKECESLPPLGRLPSLKNLKVEGMDGIKQVGLEFYGSLGCSISFPALETLSFDNLESWVKWVHLPVENYKAFPCLKKLSITSCKSLRDDLLPNLPSLKKLLIQSCPSITAINQIPLTIQSLKINECEKLRAVQSIELASSSCNDKEIEEKGVVAEAENVGSLEDTVKPHGHSAKVGSQLPHLTKVKITECPNLISLLEGFLFPALKQLEFEDCNNMEGLPSQMHKCTNLQTLRIQRCPRIDCFPEGGLLKNLTRLEIEGVNIKQPVQEWGLHILNSLHYLTLANVGRSSDSAECSSSPCSDLHLPSSLSELRITNFPNLKSISCGSTSPNLTRLWVIDCAKLESLVGDDLTLLTSLSLKSCPTFLHYILGGPPIISSNSRIGDFTLLTRLSIWDMTNIDKSIRDWGLHLLTSLENLALHNLGSSIDSVECISGPELRLPSCLMVIDIMGFRNLKSISCRSSFPNLCWLFIQCCPKFESFGDNDLPSWLTVYIYDCDLIEQHLKSNHVHRITIGSEYHPPSY